MALFICNPPNLALRPDLVEQIMTTIDTHLQTHLTSSDDNPRRSLILRRSLKLLNGIVKEFSAYKMLNGVRTMTVVRGHFFVSGSIFTAQSDCRKVSPCSL